MNRFVESLKLSRETTIPNISFEFFPPSTEKMEQTLWQSIQRLEPYAPRFVSVTYGAGGTTRERTHATVRRILENTSLTPAAHLTCVGASRAEVTEVASKYWESGVRHIVALRGDPPAGEDKYAPHPDGFANAAALVSGLKQVGDFEISVAAHPERHPDSSSWDEDLENLRRKVDAGATRAITQYFFDIDIFLRYRDKVSNAGINIELVPGILPVTNYAQVVKFSGICGASVPPWLQDLFDGLDNDPSTRQLVAASVAADQCHALHIEGVKEFHFYTLNRSELTCAICRLLGLKPTAVGNTNDAASGGELTDDKSPSIATTR